MDGRGVPAEAAYVPARSGWNNAAAELPSSSSNVGSYGRAERVNSGGSDIYYEDVDPKFAPPEPMPPLPSQAGRLPPVLAAGPPHQQTYHDESPDSVHAHHIQPPPLTNSYEDLPGARSPAESETSNFTSVSQRGVNPNWRPGYPGEFQGGGPGPMRRQSNTQARQDILLNNNPDFQLPGMTPPGRRPMGGRGGGFGPGPSGRMPPPADGPYPRGMPMIPDGGVREI
ncbi:pH-response regulator protein palI/RIM9 [Cyphellophora attinorum]|uniref:pH-response regulator protein palI/RIM9 n=1 Tax=Cyphellophora attinorum TaxID=1664694 RepID=A0A0N1GWP1_9EURO|nr:pH-response regulator protein palI/RIM9 [Phialophora attinorum]KPI34377.1 pH-response regulator protein palI/RIM9 [Phialophora attinorum]